MRAMSDAALPAVAGLRREDALAMDVADPLAPVRARFDLPPNCIYLDGNSLGALPHAARNALHEAIDDGWGRGLISSWNDRGWIDLALRLGDRLGALMGAAPGQVVVADSTSANLFKVVAAALEARSERSIVVAERDMFPTDLYMAQAVLDWGRHRGKQLQLVAREDLATSVHDDTALVLAGHVDFRSGHVLDMETITQRAHEHGALMLWDLCHSTGAVPLQLDACDVDFAVGCTYKFLNAGPGAPAYLYIARRLQPSARQPLAGWFGHASPFAFTREFEPAVSVAGFQCGTPPVLALEALGGALSVWEDVEMEIVRHKSLLLAELFMALLDAEQTRHDLVVHSPRNAATRGSQVAVAHPEGYAIMQALIAAGVVGDFRAPDLLRFGLTPLYTRYVDIWDAVDRLVTIVETRRYDQPHFRSRRRVT